MIQQQCKDFLAKEVYPGLDEIDSMKDPKLMPSILDKAGELGLPAHRYQQNSAASAWISTPPCSWPK